MNGKASNGNAGLSGKASLSGNAISGNMSLNGKASLSRKAISENISFERKSQLEREEQTWLNLTCIKCTLAQYLPL